MGDEVDWMLRRAIDVFCTDDERLARQVEAAHDRVDRLHEAISLYLAQASRGELGLRERRPSSRRRGRRASVPIMAGWWPT